MNRYKIVFADVQWDSPIPGVRHKVATVEDLKLRLVEYSPEMAPHWCTVGHVGQILTGTFEIEFNDGTQVFDAGEESEEASPEPGRCSRCYERSLGG